MKKVRFATIGTSAITELFLKGAALEPRFEYAAAYSRDADNACRFASEHGAGKHFSSLEELAACPDVDAVYVASPNSLHFSQTMAMLGGGKHVLCEKAFASNASQAEAMCRAAGERGLTLMEAMKTTHSPTFARVMENLPRIGRVRRYFASYCQYSSRYDRFKRGDVANAFRAEFSNGSLMDIGVYGVYPMAVLFGRPQSVLSDAELLHTGVDGQGTLVCRYDGMDAVIVHSKIADSSLPSEIQGEEGRIVIDRINAIDRARIIFRDGRQEDISAPHERYDMVYELSAFIGMIERGEVSHGVNSHENSLAVMEIMDAARKQNGVVYPADGEFVPGVR